MYETVQNAPVSPSHVVAVVASAGGVQALSNLVSYLPAQLPAPILIAQHLPVPRRSFLRDILQRKSRIAVRWAETGQSIAAGGVYIAPPGAHMRVTSDREIRLSEEPRNEQYQPSGNVLFQSVAESFGTQAIGIVLTGCLSDGSSGACAIYNAGGRVFVQAPEFCDYADMPFAAMRTGAVDLALPVRSLAAVITAIVTVPGASGIFTVGDSYRHRLAGRAWPLVRRSSCGCSDRLPCHPLGDQALKQKASASNA